MVHFGLSLWNVVFLNARKQCRVTWVACIGATVCNALHMAVSSVALFRVSFPHVLSCRIVAPFTSFVYCMFRTRCIRMGLPYVHASYVSFMLRVAFATVSRIGGLNGDRRRLPIC